MKHLLLRRIPLMTFVCTTLALGCTLPKAMASPDRFDYFQQSTSLKTVLNQVGDHFKITILFEENLIQGKTTTYKFNPAGAELDKVLGELLTPLGLKAMKIDKTNYAIILNTPKAEKNEEEIPIAAPAPQVRTNITAPDVTQNSGTTPSDWVVVNVQVRGRVISEEGDQPISGASVVVKGTRTGTTTDAEGYFSFKTPDARGSLQIGHVNFLPQEVAYDSRNNISVKLKTRIKEIGAVVVSTGMFKRAAENYTGASTTISGDQLRAVNNVNILEALKVFDPAIRMPDNVQFGSDPNRLPEIVVRGTNNFPQQTTSTSLPSSGADFMANYVNNPNQPLFILDGFEVSLQKVYDLDINRVANFTILKDAAATSIYGSRAANGVIVIDTKQPQSGKLRVSYNGMVQVTGPDLTVYDLTNAPEKLEVERLAGLYSTYASGLRPDADAVLRETYANRKAAVERGVNTYWLSQPVTMGYGQRHSLYMEGGDNFIRYGFDLGYNNTAGVMKNSNRNNYTAGMNFSYRYKGLLFKNTMSVVFNKAVNSNFGSFSDYTRMNPYWQPYDSNGNIVKVLEVVKTPTTPSQTTSYYNPLFNTTINTVNESRYTNIINQTHLDWLIGNGFRLTGRLQINKQHDESDYFLPAQHTNFETITDVTKKGSYTKGSGKFFSIDGNVQLDYSKQFGKHQLLNSTGGSMTQTQSDFLSVYVEGFPNDRLDQISFGNGYPPNSRPLFTSAITRMVSAYTNFSYSYDNRYNADVSIRTDGSSQFGANKRFGSFWSVGASWNLHKEKLLSDKKYISRARLRGSIGSTGDNKFQPFMGITTYQYYTDQNYRGLIGAILTAFGNENLQWQQTIKKNIGIDLGLFENRITISADFYRENTTNLILDITTPPSMGFGSYKENIGELENRGYEFKVNAFVIHNDKKRLFWSVYVNGLHNRDFIKEISNSLSKLNQTNDQGDQTKPKYRYQEGESVNTIWAVTSLGIDPSNGREVFLKKDGTLTYNWDAADKVVVGNSVPTMRGSFGTNLTYKGLSVGLYFIYEFGGQVYNQTLIDRVETTNFTYNVDRRVLLGRWAKPGDETYFKGLVDENGRTVTTATQATSRFVQDNNFVNAESISIGYSFPEKLNKRFGLSNTRITFITNDIKRWSSIEVERGLQYPFARNFTLNLSTTF
jgi:TonB-linked SusC/RagA family outer membrane protein